MKLTKSLSQRSEIKEFLKTIDIKATKASKIVQMIGIRMGELELARMRLRRAKYHKDCKNPYCQARANWSNNGWCDACGLNGSAIKKADQKFIEVCLFVRLCIVCV